MSTHALLPDTLPNDPLPIFAEWFRLAHDQAVQPNPNAMMLATATADGIPSARIVLCKELVESPGYVVFYTNYESRKGRELLANPRAAAVFHWDDLSRQVRIEGRIVKSPTAESDAYFDSRPLASKLGAWASKQSAPLSSRTQLLAQVATVSAKFALNLASLHPNVPRPPHWGGFRLWIEAVELWIEGTGRVHDRARWTRSLSPQDEFTFAADAWQATRLNP